MQSKGHSAAPRPGGGFNAGRGPFGGHLDETAMMEAMQAKGLQQQKASASTSPTPHSSTQQQPRDVGSLKDELFTYPAQDLVGSFKSVFDLDTWLGVQPTAEQEQERARKEVLLKRFNQLTDQEQAVFKQRYQERLKKLQLEEEEKAQRRQAEEQQRQASITLPRKAASGPVGPGMGAKQKAKAQLDFDRQRMDQGQKVG